jgi:enterochelin esterase-like enzyme
MILCEGVASPRLARLEAELGAGNETALEPFWKEIEVLGTPIVEAKEGQDRNVLMTLLWRQTTDTRNVVVAGGLAEADIVGNQMKKLSGTDIWYLTWEVPNDLRTTYQIAPNDPLTSVDTITSYEEWRKRTADWLADPLNPRRLIHPRDEDDPNSADRVESVIEMSAAPPHPWVEHRPGVPSGKVELHRILSENLDGEYRVWVYTPPGYTVAGEPYDLLILFDGRDHLELIPTPMTLDNLLFDGSIQPMVAVLLESPTIEARMRDLTGYPPFFKFLVVELIAWVRNHYRVTTRPELTTVGGVSLGGLAATFAALTRPDIFGNVLTQSGSFWWTPEEEIEPGWVTRQFGAKQRLPLRFYIDVGSLEPDSQLSSNRRLRDELKAKRYPVRYVEYSGAHDYISWRGLLGDGLVWLAGERRSDTEENAFECPAW